MTDSHHDELLDIETNEINNDVTNQLKLVRRKREVEEIDTNNNETVTEIKKNDTISKRSSSDELFEYYELEPTNEDDNDEQHSLDDTERGKRQIRYYVKNDYNNPGKIWPVLKPIKFVDSLPHSSYNPNVQSNIYRQNYNNQNNNNYYDGSRRPYSLESNSYSDANPLLSYQNQNSFKPSLRDPYSKPAHNPLNVATQIITKSPPISALSNQNSFTQSSGAFYNNAPQTYQNSKLYSSQGASVNRPQNQYLFDSSLLPSTIVTGKPILMSTSPRNQKQQSQNNDESDTEEDYESSEEESDDDQYSHRYPKPPYEFTHPRNKYAEIENPFANPNFDFDKYLSKLSNGQYTTHNPKYAQQIARKPIDRPVETSTLQNSGAKSSTVKYHGMSTPRPFSILPNGAVSTLTPIDISQFDGNKESQQYFQRPSVQTYLQQQQPNFNANTYNQQQHQNYNVNAYNQHQQHNSNLNSNNEHQHQYIHQNKGLSLNAESALESVKAKLKPPNFKDDRQLPLTYSFSKPIEITTKSINYQNYKGDNLQPLYSTAKPYLFLTATGTPIILSSPKTHYVVKNEKLVSQLQYHSSTENPFSVSSPYPYNSYITFKHSTAKPLTTLANEQLSALHNYWKSTTESILSQSVTPRPSTSPDVEKLKSLFAQAVKASMQTPTSSQTPKIKYTATTTIKPLKRRPIPKPSPEMNDYYYDDDEYYEPPVKSQYMPSTEIKPQRPLMAQNYKHYDDSYEDSDEEVVNISPRPSAGKPNKHSYKPELVTKNHNDVSIVTKSPLKDFNKNTNGKIPVPVLLDFVSPTPTVLGTFEIVQGLARNRTTHMRRPYHDNGPNTVKPPKYLNQTTLRPYTVRHRLAKPSAIQDHSVQKDTNTRGGGGRHPNIVAQMLTTPHDNHNQETRITKAKYDGRTNR